MQLTEYLNQGGYSADTPRNFLLQFQKYQSRAHTRILIKSVITDIRNYFDPGKKATITTQKISESRCLSVATILKTRLRTCGSVAAVTAAVLRSIGIPTKLIDGKIFRDKRWRSHAWIEAYLPTEKKFVPFDAFSIGYHVGKDHKRIASYTDWSIYCKKNKSIKD